MRVALMTAGITGNCSQAFFAAPIAFIVLQAPGPVQRRRAQVIAVPADNIAGGIANTTVNAFGGGITQAKMEAVMDAMVDSSRGFSLKSLGYQSVGLDDGWQDCGAGVNGSFHDASGEPIINTKKFPDMGAMVAKAHGLGLKAGWYLK